MKTIQQITSQFIEDLTSIVKADAREQAMAAIGGSNGVKSSKKVASGGAPMVTKAMKAKRRKGPIQLCPVPGCGERAAPVFGMVCGKHKDLPKATIKKYREARRAKNKPGKK